MDNVFQALSSQARRRMLDIIKSLPGCSVNDVAKYFDMSRIAVMKHLRVLEEAQLIISQKKGHYWFQLAAAPYGIECTARLLG